MAEIDAECNAVLNAISSEEIDKLDEQRASELLNEKTGSKANLQKFQRVGKRVKAQSHDPTKYIPYSVDLRTI